MGAENVCVWVCGENKALRTVNYNKKQHHMQSSVKLTTNVIVAAEEYHSGDLDCKTRIE